MEFNSAKTFILILFCIVSSGLRGQNVKDIDGNEYHTVKIGKQTWMVENLKVTHFRNGAEIPNIGDHMEWSFIETSAYCDYDNSPLNNDIYGKLYNFYTVINKHGLCPDGWQVPSDNDWTTLSSYLGGKDTAGVELKATGTDFWQCPTLQATNKSGFTALPGGNRSSDGAFAFMGSCGYWWSSTQFDKNDGWGRYLFCNRNNLFRSNSSKGSAFSVRCIKD